MLEYWMHRENPTPKPLHEEAQFYICKHLQGTSILDYGAGVGRCVPLYKHFDRIWTYDITARYAAELEGKLIGANYTMVFGNFYQCARQKIDVCLLSYVLHHVADLSLVLSRHTKTLGKRICVASEYQDHPQSHCFRHDYNSLRGYDYQRFSDGDEKYVMFCL